VLEGLLLVVWSSIGLWVAGWVGLWVQSLYFAMAWVGLGQSFGGLGWVGLKKLDPRTTLGQRQAEQWRHVLSAEVV